MLHIRAFSSEVMWVAVLLSRLEKTGWKRYIAEVLAAWLIRVWLWLRDIDIWDANEEHCEEAPSKEESSSDY